MPPRRHARSRARALSRARRPGGGHTERDPAGARCGAPGYAGPWLPRPRTPRVGVYVTFSSRSVGSPPPLGAAGIGTLPRVGTLDQLRGSTRQVRANPWLTVGVAIGTLIVCVWIGWAIHVTSDHGAREGLGVLIAWPAILAALVL